MFVGLELDGIVGSFILEVLNVIMFFWLERIDVNLECWCWFFY